MTSNELKNKVLEANSKLDLCLSFLSQNDMNLFVKYLSEACEALKTCRSALSSETCELEIEVRDILMNVVCIAGTRANQYVNLGYQIFGTEKFNAALGD